MSDDKAKLAVQMHQLVEQIRHHNKLYYNQDAPSISDAEYDQMYRELQRLEATYPEQVVADTPTRIIGGVAGGGFSKVTHHQPMLSLEKAHDDDDLQRFFKRLERFTEKECIALPKLDGVAISLVYTDGLLTYGATRGDGIVGEKVTANLRHVKGVPAKLSPAMPADLEVRGEVVMSKHDFAKHNEKRGERGQKKFVNPRNAAAGGIRQLQQDKERLVSMRFYAYWALSGDDDAWSTASETFKQLASVFECCSPIRTCEDLAAFAAYRDLLTSQRDVFPVDIDGIVLRLNDNVAARKLGYNAKAPRAMIAYKFDFAQVITTLTDIDYQVGRSGVLTPVGKLLPVHVGGVTVSSVTLHNCGMVTSRRLHAGDCVAIIRAGDVIPKLQKVLEDKRLPAAVPFVLPSQCPVCAATLEQVPIMKSSLVQTQTTVDVCVQESFNLFCVSLACAGQLQQRLSHFVSRQALDIKGFGDKLLHNLIVLDSIKRPSDMFALSVSQLATALQHNKDEPKTKRKEPRKQPDKLLGVLAKARTTTLARVLHALGLPGLGVTCAQALATAFGNLANLIATSPSVMCFVDQVQWEVAVMLQAQLKGAAGEELARLRKHGVAWPAHLPAGGQMTIITVLRHVEYLAKQEQKVSLSWPKLGSTCMQKLTDLKPSLVSLRDLATCNEGLFAPMQGKQNGDLQDLSNPLHMQKLQELISELQARLALSFGIDAIVGGALAGQVIVITGTLPNYTRQQAQQLVSEQGGKAATAVTSHTSKLVLGDKPGKAKVRKASLLQVKTVSAEEFLASLGKT